MIMNKKRAGEKETFKIKHYTYPNNMQVDWIYL